MATHKSLVLVGMMGTGKSTIGKEVAKKLKIEFVDTDTLIEDEANLTIAEIFKKNGEKYFSCLLYTSPSPRDRTRSRMPSYA